MTVGHADDRSAFGLISIYLVLFIFNVRFLDPATFWLLEISPGFFIRSQVADRR